MSDNGVNNGRRRFLVAATSVVGAAGVAGAVTPFFEIVESKCQGPCRRCSGQSQSEQARSRPTGGLRMAW